MIDSYRHKGLRQKLVETIREKGIKDVRILEAIGKVPRHFFMDSGFVEFAYRDQAFPIAAGQTISQPYTVAFQTELLQVKKHEKVLEVGTGSGYQCAILLELGAKVHTIERQRELFLKAKTKLNEMGYKPYFYYGDGYLGQASQAPFDKILITAGAPEIPRDLLKQLNIGGRMVVPVGGSSGQVMIAVDRISEEEYKETEHGYFAFVPMLKGKQ
ncbi:MAG: protein-L-isoaspartate O-methyltransferase [Bacteroidetes bacterium GWF2_33_16]|nr:MAG: protein-L-isoaspartate O-methyltransferase [Bacteroidetes bacterium GWE2_32_14]OFY06850.1 MAG: protein-L-isoaspartate O-methyltransferase [Bacteroidetes bacterium GWF2_33_16]